jgi:hypothetical protein
MSTETKYELRMSSDGRQVVFTAVPPNESAVSIAITADAIGKLVVGFLGVAIACAQRTQSNAPPLSAESSLSELLYVQASAVELADITDKPDVVGLSFLFGQTRVAVGLPRAALKQLGQDLLVASVDSTQPQ